MMIITNILLIMLWTVLLLYIIKCWVNYEVRKCKEIYLCFITMYQIAYHMVYHFAMLLLKSSLWKPFIHGCLVNTNDEMFFKQLRAHIING
jgi:hypothetical protein